MLNLEGMPCKEIVFTTLKLNLILQVGILAEQHNDRKHAENPLKENRVEQNNVDQILLIVNLVFVIAVLSFQ